MTSPQSGRDEAVSSQDVRHVALLARLELSEAQVEEYSSILNRILKHMRKLDELNTDGVPPTSHPAPIPNVLREDQVRPSLPVEEALANAPVSEANCFKVPQIIQES
jgi:aspartyl-tRNA(Asn)/glutamyl-tRNA(Gln) amidotransferase subunit C